MKARVLAGIDEAGLGPMLGPLALGVCAVRFPKDLPANAGRLLWDQLQEAVVETPRRGEERLIVADSKVVYKRNPLGWSRLESTALTWLMAVQTSETQSSARTRSKSNTSTGSPEKLRLQSFCISGQEPLDAPWYEDLPKTLPVVVRREDLDDHRTRLHQALQGHGLTVCVAGLRLLSARELNASFDQTQSKAATAWNAVVGILGDLMERFGKDGIQAIVDRQGGRKHYGALLQRDFPGCGVVSEREGKERSDYWIYGPHGDMWVSFRVGSETESLPTAAASCFAKYGREVSMRAFNQYFERRIPDIRPTAGYVTDARRWLKDAKEGLQQLEIPHRGLVRER